METNEELIKEFEARRNFSLEECKAYINKELSEYESQQIMEVDNIFEYMKSLGYLSLDEIKEKYNL